MDRWNVLTSKAVESGGQPRMIEDCVSIEGTTLKRRDEEAIVTDGTYPGIHQSLNRWEQRVRMLG